MTLLKSPLALTGHVFNNVMMAQTAKLASLILSEADPMELLLITS